MTFEELRNQGRAMDQAQLQEGMRSLIRDDRFMCVIGWLDRNREAFVQKYSMPTTSESGGKLAHAAGSIHAIHMLEAQLAHMAKTGAAAGGPTKDADE
jgi:hypothetical protein